MTGIRWMEPVDSRSAPDVRIALFRSLFRGREDVYPRRFESRRTGRSGYAPACGNEWVPGICEKPRIQCADCPHRRFLPVTDDVIRWHLSGRDNAGQPFVAGGYPRLLDETCFCLAADFDEEAWRKMPPPLSKRVVARICRALSNVRAVPATATSMTRFTSSRISSCGAPENVRSGAGPNRST